MKLILSENKELKENQADPFIFRDGSDFYLYCTGVNGVHCYKSDKLSDFSYIGIVLSEAGCKQYWAPCVCKVEDKYYMYYSSMPASFDDVHLQRLKVAVADTPQGPFVFEKQIADPFSIDPEVVLTSEGQYMFYSINDYNSNCIGTKIVIDKMSGSLELANDPRAAVSPTLDEEIYCRDRFKKGQDWYTVEGASYFYEDGWHYLLYSGNCYENNNYYIGYSRAKSDSDSLEGVTFLKYPDDKTYFPLLASDGLELGTGHNSTIKVGDQRYIVYHGRDASDDLSTECRTARIAKLMVNDGILKVEKI